MWFFSRETLILLLNILPCCSLDYYYDEYNDYDNQNSSSACQELKDYLSRRLEFEMNAVGRRLHRGTMTRFKSQLTVQLQKRIPSLIRTGILNLHQEKSASRTSVRHEREIGLYKVRLKQNIRELYQAKNLLQSRRTKIRVETEAKIAAGTSVYGNATSKLSSLQGVIDVTAMIAHVLKMKMDKEHDTLTTLLSIAPSNNGSKPNLIDFLRSAFHDMRTELNRVRFEIQITNYELRALRAGSGSNGNQVKFQVRLSKVMEQNSSTPTTMKFDSVIYNDGNGYDETTGIFTAPVSGNYYLWARLICNVAEKFTVRLVQNGNVKSTNECSSKLPKLLRIDVFAETLLLESGDRVWFENEQAQAILGVMIAGYGGFFI